MANTKTQACWPSSPLSLWVPFVNLFKYLRSPFWEVFEPKFKKVSAVRLGSFPPEGRETSGIRQGPNLLSAEGVRFGEMSASRELTVLHLARKYYPFHSQEWSISNFSCSLTRNITSHSMENLTFHSLLIWEMIILPILTTSLIHVLYKSLENVLFELSTHLFWSSSNQHLATALASVKLAAQTLIRVPPLPLATVGFAFFIATHASKAWSSGSLHTLHESRRRPPFGTPLQSAHVPSSPPQMPHLSFP